MRYKRAVSALLVAIAVLAVSAIPASTSTARRPGATTPSALARSSEPSTTTPIKHVVVIFQENVSFDHYFGTYPHAANSDGQPFKAAKGTPAVDGLTPATDPSLPPSPAAQHEPAVQQPERVTAAAAGQQRDRPAGQSPAAS